MTCDGCGKRLMIPGYTASYEVTFYEWGGDDVSTDFGDIKAIGEYCEDCWAKMLKAVKPVSKKVGK